MRKATRRWVTTLIPIVAASCFPPGAYQPPPRPASTEFSRELNASFDQTWAAVTFVAGSTFFNIKNFDKGSGLMTLDYSNMRGGPGNYITCGTMNGGLKPMQMITSEPNSILNMLGNSLTLSGRANITVRSRGPQRTTVQINSSYDLVVDRILSDTKTVEVAHWQFTSREPDTQIVQALFMPRIPVTCQPSFKIESDFLTEVASRL